MPIDRNGLASDAFAITPSDSTQQRSGAIYAGAGGSIAVRTEDGTTLTFGNAAAGSIIPVKVTMILATGTTATGLIGFR
jgi:hypothetical protein